MECLETQDPDYWKSELTRSRDVRLAHFCGVLAVVALRRPFC